MVDNWKKTKNVGNVDDSMSPRDKYTSDGYGTATIHSQRVLYFVIAVRFKFKL